MENLDSRTVDNYRATSVTYSYYKDRGEYEESRLENLCPRLKNCPNSYLYKLIFVQCSIELIDESQNSALRFSINRPYLLMFSNFRLIFYIIKVSFLNFTSKFRRNCFCAIRFFQARLRNAAPLIMNRRSPMVKVIVISIPIPSSFAFFGLSILSFVLFESTFVLGVVIASMVLKL